jgi:polyhydroxybutyrate depolymerase
MSRTHTIIAIVLATLVSGGPVAAQDQPGAGESPPRPSAGCGTAGTQADVPETGALTLDGVERTWRIHVPSAYDGVTPVPLVVLLHGLGEDAGIIRNFTTSGLPDEAGFAVVAPLGSGVITRWMWDLDDSEYELSLENPDMAFIDALLDELGGSLCLDEARTYAAGYSNGAIGVSALGCVLEDRLAAIAGVNGLTDFGDGCALDRPLPTLGIQAEDDPYVLIGGGWGDIGGFMLEDFVSFADQPITSWPGFALSFDERLASIAGRNGCSGSSETVALSEQADVTTWDCPPGADVRFIVTRGSGHAWPTSVLDASAAIWDFFAQQARSG